MDKKKPDFRKEALNAIRSVENEPKGVIQIITDCRTQTSMVEGPPEILANMIANAIMKDATLFEAINNGLKIVLAKVINGAKIGEK